MKKNKKIFKKTMETGFFLIPVTMGVICYFWKGGIPPDKPVSPGEWLFMFGAGCEVSLLYWAERINSLKELNKADGLNAAKRPEVPEDMLYRKPIGFCFGTYKNQYVCKRVDEPGSILVQGSSGSGKSASIIQGFLLNPENKQNCRSLVLDLKSELKEKCVSPKDIYSVNNPSGDTIILDPKDRKNGCGFDPFFMLDDRSTDSQVHDVMETVAISIIPSKNDKDAIWSISARQLLRGLLTYFYIYESLRTLPAIIKRIKTDNIKNIINTVLSRASPDSAAYMDIINFKDMADETLTSVDLDLSSRIITFATNQDLVWCLGESPRKCSSDDLLKKNIFICIPEDKLTEFGALIFLIFNLTIKWMMALPEKEQDPNRPYLCMILDETVALLAGIEANMPMLTQCLRIGARSKGCTMLICVQSISGLYQTLGKEETKDLVSNCQYKYILDSTDSESSKEVIGWGGKYLKRKVSRVGSGTKGKDTYSYTEENILKEQELITLPKDDDIILISSRAGYLRLKKCLVFKDKYFKALLDQIKDEKGGY